MARILLLVASCLALSGCGGVRVSCAKPDAESIVSLIKPDENFRTILTMLVKRTQTGQMIAGAGEERALTEAIDTAVQRHGDEWERNLVKGWSSLDSAELKQVCDAVEVRDSATYDAFAARVGSKVQELNEPVLTIAASEVLETAFRTMRHN